MKKLHWAWFPAYMFSMLYIGIIISMTISINWERYLFYVCYAIMATMITGCVLNLFEDDE